MSKTSSLIAALLLLALPALAADLAGQPVSECPSASISEASRPASLPGTLLLALADFCPIHQGCEVEAQCHPVKRSCQLGDDFGINSCQLGPGDSFDCPPGKTVHLETCPCTGNGCTASSGTYLTCA